MNVGRKPLVVGVDGCKAGWLAISIDGRRSVEVEIFQTMDSLWDSWGESAASVLIDVPIGLPDAESARACDREARALLKWPRASSVFNPPVRSALSAQTITQAKALNQSASGRRITQQTWAIFPKIREVDRFIRSAPDRQRHLREVHPEVLFHVLNRGSQLNHPKRRTKGIQERLEILERYFGSARATAESAFRSIPRRVAKRDDVVDALAAAVVAHEFSGRLGAIPEIPRRDSVGLTMEMVIPTLVGE